MKVICIDGDFSTRNCEAVRNILRVGDDHLLPQTGEIYEVLGYGHLDEHGETKEPIDAYELDLPDHTHYGAKILFNKQRFAILDDTFVPNQISDQGELIRRVNMYVSIRY